MRERPQPKHDRVAIRNCRDDPAAPVQGNPVVGAGADFVYDEPGSPSVDGHIRTAATAVPKRAGCEAERHRHIRKTERRNRRLRRRSRIQTQRRVARVAGHPHCGGSDGLPRRRSAVLEIRAQQRIAVSRRHHGERQGQRQNRTPDHGVNPSSTPPSRRIRTSGSSSDRYADARSSDER